MAKQPFIRAVAGAGKTILAGGVMFAAIAQRKMAGRTRPEKIVWLTQTRAQRDAALASLRKLFRSFFSVTVVGRLAMQSATDCDDGQFDVEFEKEMRRQAVVISTPGTMNCERESNHLRQRFLRHSRPSGIGYVLKPKHSIRSKSCWRERSSVFCLSCSISSTLCA